MGKKDNKKPDGEGKGKKRGKKKKGYATLPIEDALACPPSAKFFYELVVGNGIGEDAVNDAVEAYRRAWESRREKALEAAQKHEHDCGKSCGSGEHLILGPFSAAGLARRRRRSAARNHLELARLPIGALLPKELTE